MEKVDKHPLTFPLTWRQPLNSTMFQTEDNMCVNSILFSNVLKTTLKNEINGYRRWMISVSLTGHLCEHAAGIHPGKN